jgi:hypothetical protein
MKSLPVKFGVVLAVFGLSVFGCTEAIEWDSGNFGFHFTAMKIIFFLFGIISTMVSIVLVCVFFDVEQKMPSFFFLTATVASLLFWALITGLVRL